MNNTALMLLKLQDNDCLERCDSIEELSNYIEETDIADSILHCFNDRKYLVRCEAYDAFYEYRQSNIMSYVIDRLKKERSKCARMYLCSALCSLIKIWGCDDKTKQTIIKYYKKETSIAVLISYWTILYLLTKDISYVDNILNCLNEEDYHIRCNVINLLVDIEDEHTINRIKVMYEKQLLAENSAAVRNLLLDRLEHYKIM